jgi:hypothetical protein
MRWTTASLLAAAGDVEVAVEVTPTGRGDDVVQIDGEDLFVMPDTQHMRLADFLADADGTAVGSSVGGCAFTKTPGKNSETQWSQAPCGRRALLEPPELESFGAITKSSG